MELPEQPVPVFSYLGKSLALRLPHAASALPSPHGYTVPESSSTDLRAALLTGFEIDPSARIGLLPYNDVTADGEIERKLQTDPPSVIMLEHRDDSVVQLAPDTHYVVLTDRDNMTAGPTAYSGAPGTAMRGFELAIYPAAAVTHGGNAVTVRFMIDAAIQERNLALERLTVATLSNWRIASFSPVSEKRAWFITHTAGYTVGAGVSAGYPVGATVDATLEYAQSTSMATSQPIEEWGCCAVRRFTEYFVERARTRSHFTEFMGSEVGSRGESGSTVPSGYQLILPPSSRPPRSGHVPVDEQHDGRAMYVPAVQGSVTWDLFLQQTAPGCCSCPAYPLQSTAQLAKEFEIVFEKPDGGMAHPMELEIAISLTAEVREFKNTAKVEDRTHHMHLLCPGKLLQRGSTHMMGPLRAQLHVPIRREWLLGSYVGEEHANVLTTATASDFLARTGDSLADDRQTVKWMTHLSHK